MTDLKVSYTYDEAGNRISRTDLTGSTPAITYYMYDPSGNILAIYNGSNITEAPIYGSGRLGTYTYASNAYAYELRDNVGSVRVVINRNKKADGTVDVLTYNDYYPYGSIARNGGVGYRYEYQGAYAEKDPITGWNNFDLRMYDGRIGRWLSSDPKNIGNSPYIGMANNPTIFKDKDGGDPSTDVIKNSDGTYTVVGGNIHDNDRNIYVVDASGKRTGEIMVKH
ncbi:hypothetical protein LLH06_10140 [Mucilaginibacter daejeonensis]|uniref:RHS repeat-associated core domain-containing protein n=1 Tax=Mucilaginibacter daejeonensis TaxID=398049 RepID=UPI001D172803|nr:RHS repeat-associated core domain-containing protein [Mucilaginibacter daejeonensis]UEG55319.1 hypothetical protein LLH06_10140 [Mucilaginibacter daejeonensis]